MKYGYCRISTPKQNIERQVRNIEADHQDATIIREVYTGRKMNRPNWDKLRKVLHSGDTVVFDSVSRMSRNANEGVAEYMELYDAGVELVFLKEPQINTATYKNAIKQSVQMTGTAVDCILKGINEYLITLAKEQVRLAFEQSEKEVEDLRQRTREGLTTAKMNGKQVGAVQGAKYNVKKSSIAKEIIRKHSKDFGGTLNDIETMKLTGLARNTYYKYKKELLDE